jgi:hypothetical protein
LGNEAMEGCILPQHADRAAAMPLRNKCDHMLKKCNSHVKPPRSFRHRSTDGWQIQVPGVVPETLEETGTCQAFTRIANTRKASSTCLFMNLYWVLAESAIQLPQLFCLLDASAATSCRDTRTNDRLEGCRRLPHAAVFSICK